MAKIIPLCSSSKGNSVYIGNKKTGLLIDAGCSFKRIKELLALNEIPLGAVKALLITHEHSDHINGLFQFTKQTDIPVYASNGTLDYLVRKNKVASLKRLYSIDELKNAPSDYEITAFRTPHDSSESVGYTFKDGNGCKIAYCTDLGTVTGEVYKNVTDSDIVFLESNYEPDMLRNNPRYDYVLKKRIFSDFGHLSNHDSAEFIKNLVSNGTRRVIIGHLSEENNTPETAAGNVINVLAECGFRAGSDYLLDVAPVIFCGKTMVI